MKRAHCLHPLLFQPPFNLYRLRHLSRFLFTKRSQMEEEGETRYNRYAKTKDNYAIPLREIRIP